MVLEIRTSGHRMLDSNESPELQWPTNPQSFLCFASLEANTSSISKEVYGVPTCMYKLAERKM